MFLPTNTAGAPVPPFYSAAPRVIPGLPALASALPASGAARVQPKPGATPALPAFAPAPVTSYDDEKPGMPVLIWHLASAATILGACRLINLAAHTL